MERIFDTQVLEINTIIKKQRPIIYELLSERGQAIYFPKRGILNQTAEARACNLNATIGVAYDDNGTVMSLKAIQQHLNGMDPETIFPYAPGTGIAALRNRWLEKMVKKNSSLAGLQISLPMVTGGLTHSLCVAGYLFVNHRDPIILPTPYWENYNLIFENSWYGTLTSYPMFTQSKIFNLEGLDQKLQTQPVGKKIVLFNFPNNPTGYTPTTEEVYGLIKHLVNAAEQGNKLIVIIDDAYFGLFYEEETFKESIFSLLANAHENILAIKCDAPTKEDYSWGFRIGFITLGTKNGSAALYAALENKLSGTIRATVSSLSHPGQSLLLAGYNDPSYETQCKEKYSVLKKRHQTICNILNTHPEYEQTFTVVPHNSGYFMCVRVKPGVNAEQVRQLLLRKYSTGIIVCDDLIRIAFSQIVTPKLHQLFENIHLAIGEVISQGK